MKTPIIAAAILANLALPAIAATVEVPNPLGGSNAARREPAPAQGRPATPAPAAKAPQAAPAPGTVFPKAVDPRYAKDGAGKARMQTCLDQYRANASAGNGGLKWIEKGGGYYSECNKRLKG